MSLFKLTFSLGVSLASGAIGTLATIPNIPTWYAALEKPLLNPPNWIFEPVWTTLYVLMGISLYLVWTAKSKNSKQNAYLLFGTQLILNTLWSIVFFGFHAPWMAVVIILALLATIIITMMKFRRFSLAAGWLFIPYIAWVSFATYLNVSIAILN